MSKRPNNDGNEDFLTFGGSVRSSRLRALWHGVTFVRRAPSISLILNLIGHVCVDNGVLGRRDLPSFIFQL